MYEKFRRVRYLAIAAGTLAVITALAACGGSAAGPSGSNTGDRTIEFSLTGGTAPAQTQVIKNAIAAFEKANKGVTVKLTQVGWGDAYSQYKTRLTAGNPPDIALLAPSWVSTFMKDDAFASADQYVNSAILDNAYKTGYDGMVGKDGTRYGVQWDASVWGMFYRTDLFAKAGLDPKAPPTTWEELRKDSAALAAAGIHPLAIPFNGTDPDDYFLPMMWQAGAEVVGKNGDVVLDSPQTLKAATFLSGLVKDKYLSTDVVGHDWEATMNTFIAGDAAIMFNGPWVVGSLKSGAPQLKGSWATAKYPEGPAGPATLGYPNGLVISKLSKNQRLAGEFINFLFQKGNPNYFFEFMKASGVYGFTKDFATTNDEFVRDPLNLPFIKSIPFARNRPVTPWYEEFRQRTFDPGVQQLILGTLTPEEFVKKVQKGAQQLATQK